MFAARPPRYLRVVHQTNRRYNMQFLLLWILGVPLSLLIILKLFGVF